MQTNPGRFFEEYRPGDTIVHAVPRTLPGGERTRITPCIRPSTRCIPRTSSRGAAARVSPPDDLIAFHAVFGTSVPDISLNVIANPGCAEGRWLSRVWPGADPFARTGREGQGPARGSAGSG